MRTSSSEGLPSAWGTFTRLGEALGPLGHVKRLRGHWDMWRGSGATGTCEEALGPLGHVKRLRGHWDM